MERCLACEADSVGTLDPCSSREMVDSKGISPVFFLSTVLVLAARQEGADDFANVLLRFPLCSPPPRTCPP